MFALLNPVLTTVFVRKVHSRMIVNVFDHLLEHDVKVFLQSMVSIQKKTF